MDNRAYWIWMQQAFGAGSPLPWRIHRSVPGGVEAFYQGGPRLWNSLGGIREQEAAALFSFSLEEAQAQLEHALKVGWEVLTPACGEYPQALTHIYDPPAVLYGKGKLPDMDSRPALAVVGARKATPETQEKAREFGYQLALGGASVVTGGAVGVDAAVALGAMSGGGPVVSVLPVALNSPYLSKNHFLRQSILEKGGALLTEYFAQQTPGFGTFQVRNRLITGLACGVLLLQAARKSGTVMYASYAKDQNRDVFVWPGPQGDPAFAGGWDLLEDGAKAVECGEEILEELQYRFAGRGKIISLPAPRAWRAEEEAAIPVLADPGLPALSQAQAAVLAALTDTPQTMAQLEEAAGLPAGQLLGALTELELLGQAQSHQGKRYSRRFPALAGRQAPSARSSRSSPGGGPIHLTGEQAVVLTCLTKAPQPLEQLEKATGLPAGKVLEALQVLEGMGLARPCPGGGYCRA
ncbi:dNA protecting protein DprA [Firmicutes bacterium CAG:94]|nr:dNA protecting protein DprA [Firmicutes bacterium CAG:94]